MDSRGVSRWPGAFSSTALAVRVAAHEGGLTVGQVAVGGHNLTDVQVVAGLEAGDRVFLVRPPGAQLPPDAEPPPIGDAPRAGEPEAANAGEPSETEPHAASGSE